MTARPYALAVALTAAIPLAAWATRPPATRWTATERAEMAVRIRGEFLHAWNNYKRFAWGHDELNPVSRTPHDWHASSLLMTPVDALDTLLVMGLDGEAAATRAYLTGHLRFDKDIVVKNFEIVIRILGGLLSAHQMTGDARLLALAEDLGNRLKPVFDSPTGLPYMYVNLANGRTSGVVSNPAEIGTLILEFGTLAKLTGRSEFLEKARRALLILHERRADTGLVGEGINVETGAWTNPASHVGGGIDSYFEYLLKCERLFGDAQCGEAWRASVRAVNAHLSDDVNGALWYGEADMRTGRRTARTYGALHAFWPAVLAMGGDLDRARRLQDSSFRMWTLHRVEPELIDYGTMQVVSAGYQLRPEIIESAYYLHHYTGDTRYLDMGQRFLDDLQANCRVENGYTTLKSVITGEQGDRQHSFFLAETLKYLYLLFAPGAVDFDAVTFNTEAHPLRRTWK